MFYTKFIKQHGIKIMSELIDSNPNAPDWKNARHYRVVLSRRDGDKYKRMTIYFSQGIGIESEPDAARVLEALVLDALSVENRSFEEWAREYGYDPDSRRAEQIFKACQKEARRLRKFLGTDLYEKLMGRSRIY